MENNNSSLYAQKAVESFYLDRPYGIRIDYSRKGFVLFNRKLNLLGMDKWNSIEELPLEEYDNPEEIPVEGVDIQRNSSKVDVFFYTDKSSPYHNETLDMECLKKIQQIYLPFVSIAGQNPIIKEPRAIWHTVHGSGSM